MNEPKGTGTLNRIVFKTETGRVIIRSSVRSSFIGDISTKGKDAGVGSLKFALSA